MTPALTSAVTPTITHVQNRGSGPAAAATTTAAIATTATPARHSRRDRARTGWARNATASGNPTTSRATAQTNRRGAAGTSTLSSFLRSDEIPVATTSSRAAPAD